MSESPEELVRRRARIRIYSGAVGHSDHVMAEGEVIGYCDRPTLLIADDTGRQSSWSVDLPREDVPQRQSAVSAPREEPPGGRAQFRAALIDVITHHPKVDIGSCLCGWGSNTGQLGKSHAAHVADTAMGRLGDAYRAMDQITDEANDGP